MPRTSSSGSKAKKISGTRLGSSSKDKKSGNRRLAKDESDSILNEVIDEESFQQSKADDDSIKEDSIINELESEIDKKKSSESIVEESIIREEYDNDNFKVHTAAQSLEARNRVKYNMNTVNQIKPMSELDRQK